MEQMFNPSERTPETGRENLRRLQETLDEIRQYREYVNRHLREYPKEEKKVSVKASETRTIDLQHSSTGNFYLKDTTALPNGKTHSLSYEVNPTDRGNGRNNQGYLHFVSSQSLRTAFDFNGHRETENLESFNGLQVLGLEEDGLHVRSQEQLEWDHAWRKFQRALCENQKFYEFLNRIEQDKETSHEIQRWAHDLIYGDIEVPDAETFLKEITDYWKMAVGGSLPTKLIPKFKSSQRPPDAVYEPESVQKTVSYIHERLGDCIQRLDKELLRESHPYRDKPKTV